MRKPKPNEDDEGEVRRKKKAHLMKKHPNKHHEGDRKRWRDEITERERKRYEAVWASNKGLHTAQGLESNVCNLVVRDIFSRSRLHPDVLEEVYSLIDRKQNGGLERDEFVVGLWLIDQRLKGRKLPIRVSDSVWKSVGVLGGIKGKLIPISSIELFDGSRELGSCFRSHHESSVCVTARETDPRLSALIRFSTQLQC
jgi:hypothetical protein